MLNEKCTIIQPADHKCFSGVSGFGDEHEKRWTYLVKGSGSTVPAESIYNQEVPNNPSDTNSKDDGADGVVGMVRNINRPKWEWGLRRHHYLQDKT